MIALLIWFATGGLVVAWLTRDHDVPFLDFLVLAASWPALVVFEVDWEDGGDD